MKNRLENVKLGVGRLGRLMQNENGQHIKEEEDGQ